MTRVLTTDADLCFTSGISSDIWKEIGAKLGFSAVAIAATTAVAATGSTTVAGGGAGAAASAPAASAGGASAAAVAQGSNLLSVMLAVGAGVAAIAAASIFLQPASDGVSRAPVAQDGFSSSVAEMWKEERTASDALPQESTPASAGLAGQKAVILIENETLRYPVGQVPGEAQILLDSGAKGLDETGDEVELVVLEYNQVDFRKPDEYYVYLAVEGSEESRRVVIISVE